jgi:hypothetical protein
VKSCSGSHQNTNIENKFRFDKRKLIKKDFYDRKILEVDDFFLGRRDILKQWGEFMDHIWIGFIILDRGNIYSQTT